MAGQIAQLEFLGLNEWTSPSKPVRHAGERRYAGSMTYESDKAMYISGGTEAQDWRESTNQVGFLSTTPNLMLRSVLTNPSNRQT